MRVAAQPASSRDSTSAGACRPPRPGAERVCSSPDWRRRRTAIAVHAGRSPAGARQQRRACCTPGGVTPRPRLLSRTVSRAAARGRRCAHSRRDVLHSSRWSKVSAPRRGETNRRRARRTHARRAPVADLARSLPRALPAERRAGGASRKQMPSEQMLLSICSCRESLERSPRSASRRPAPATFASRAAR